jgi:hypothetical protein
MAKDRPPSYQWYPRDFAATMHQLGIDGPVEFAYRRALDASWEEGAYGVGSEEDWLRWGRVSEEDKRAFRVAIGSLTISTLDGTLVQLRMARERMEQAMRHEQAREAGGKGGRKSKRPKNIKPRQATLERPLSDPQATLKQTQPHSFASAFESTEESKNQPTPTTQDNLSALPVSRHAPPEPDPSPPKPPDPARLAVLRQQADQLLAKP